MSWGTKEELEFIDYMASNKYRDDTDHITMAEMKLRLSNYIKTLHKRSKFSFNRFTCEKYAQKLRQRL